MNVGSVGGAASAGMPAAGAGSSAGSAAVGGVPSVGNGSDTSQVSQVGKSAGENLNDNSINQTVNNNTTIFSNTNISTADMIGLRQGSSCGMNGLSSSQSINPMSEGQDMQKMMEKLMEIMMLMMIMKIMEQLMGGSAGASAG